MLSDQDLRTLLRVYQRLAYLGRRARMQMDGSLSSGEEDQESLERGYSGLEQALQNEILSSQETIPFETPTEVNK